MAAMSYRLGRSGSTYERLLAELLELWELDWDIWLVGLYLGLGAGLYESIGLGLDEVSLCWPCATR